MWLFWLTGCTEAPQTADAPTKPTPVTARERSTASSVVRTVNPAWAQAETILEQSRAAADVLNTAVQNLLQSPTIEHLEQAQNAWRQAAAQIEGFHIFSRLGSVAPQMFHDLLQLQFNVSAWPIQPGYLDSYGQHPYSGIVFDVGVPMTEDVLREQHGMTDNGDATLGLYALEFLLFGEGNQRGPLAFLPITALDEQLRADGYEDITELPRNRRRELLRLQAQLLSEDVTTLRDNWRNSQPDQVKDRFETLTASQQRELLQKAALALITEQIVTLANQQSAGSQVNAPDLWSNQQFADRLSAQLQGLQMLHDVVPLGPEVTTAISQSIQSLRAVAALPSVDGRGTATRVDWQSAYQALRNLLQTLNGSGSNAETTSPSV